MNICSRRGNEADFLENGHNRPPPHQAVRKLRNGILEERKKGSRTPRRQRKRAISKLWRSFFQGRRLARSFRTVCYLGGYFSGSLFKAPRRGGRIGRAGLRGRNW